jgi:hypothetical protein
MNTSFGRRSFFKKSLGAALAAPLAVSLEEQALLAQTPAPVAKTTPASFGSMPNGKIGKVSISRLICGGNLVGGWAHSRDLVYVSPLMKHYFTDDKIMETWALCEEHGVNTMVVFSLDVRAIELYKKYRKLGGKIQYLAQIKPDDDNLETSVRKAADDGAVGAFLLGNIGDLWTSENKVTQIGALMDVIKDHGMIAGIAAHELRTVRAIEEAKIAPDFYVKTLHHTNYWSTRRPDQTKEVIDSYPLDNYWCMNPPETIEYMTTVKRPWIAYKVLAAGAIRPRDGFKYAFSNGADFALVGMFDFQVREDVEIATQVIKQQQKRTRAWMA